MKKLKLKQKNSRKKLSPRSHLAQISKNSRKKLIFGPNFQGAILSPNIIKKGKILKMVLIFLLNQEKTHFLELKFPITQGKILKSRGKNPKLKVKTQALGVLILALAQNWCCTSVLQHKLTNAFFDEVFFLRTIIWENIFSIA